MRVTAVLCSRIRRDIIAAVAGHWHRAQTIIDDVKAEEKRRVDNATADQTTAVTTASAAVTTAQQALTAAQQALTVAQAANPRVDADVQRCEAAVNTGQTALTNATTALTNARTAKETAVNALPPAWNGTPESMTRAADAHKSQILRTLQDRWQAQVPGANDPVVPVDAASSTSARISDMYGDWSAVRLRWNMFVPGSSAALFQRPSRPLPSHGRSAYAVTQASDAAFMYHKIDDAKRDRMRAEAERNFDDEHDLTQYIGTCDVNASGQGAEAAAAAAARPRIGPFAPLRLCDDAAQRNPGFSYAISSPKTDAQWAQSPWAQLNNPKLLRVFLPKSMGSPPFVKIAKEKEKKQFVWSARKLVTVGKLSEAEYTAVDTAARSNRSTCPPPCARARPRCGCTDRTCARVLLRAVDFDTIWTWYSGEKKLNPLMPLGEAVKQLKELWVPALSNQPKTLLSLANALSAVYHLSITTGFGAVQKPTKRPAAAAAAAAGAGSAQRVGSPNLLDDHLGVAGGDDSVDIAKAVALVKQQMQTGDVDVDGDSPKDSETFDLHCQTHPVFGQAPDVPAVRLPPRASARV